MNILDEMLYEDDFSYGLESIFDAEDDFGYDTFDFDDFDEFDFAEEGIKEFGGKVVGGIKRAPGNIKNKVSNTASNIKNRKTVEVRLQKVEKQLMKMAKSKDGVEKIAKFEAGVVTEASKIKEALTKMSKVSQQLNEGKIDKKYAKAQIKPLAKYLRGVCHVLKYGTIVEDKYNVTSEDIKALTTYVAGVKQLINNAKKAAAEAPAGESYLGDIDDALDMFNEDAMFDFDDYDFAGESLMDISSFVADRM